MSGEGAEKQLANSATAQEEVAIDATSGSSSKGNVSLPASSQPQTEVKDEATKEKKEDPSAIAEESASATTGVKPDALEDATATIDSALPTEATTTTEASPTTSPATAPQSLGVYNVETEAPMSSAEGAKAELEMEQDDTDFVQPDIEHIVSTGATHDGASSMQALRELVAQARASTGQPREALPPGFGDDDDDDEDEAPPAHAQRGKKRKAEAELEELVQSSAGIDEVKAAAEKSQHPETKTLLQKALSSLSSLVSRRPKADPDAATPPATDPEQSRTDDADADSSDDSDSDSSSGDSSDDEDDEDDAAQAGLTLADDDDDEEGGGPSGSTAPATKNEILAPDVEQPAIQEVTEAEKRTLRKLGKVHSIVDSVVVVEQDVTKPEPGSANAGSVPVDSTGRQGEREGEYSVLDTGSLLCFEDGKVLGLVFETFGSIHNPMYSIQFASAAAIDRDVVEKGKAVFYLPAQSTYVLTQLLRSMKGSDASNMWDEEVAEDEIDYSDDEQEAEAKRRAKAIRSGKVDDSGNPVGAARTNKRQKNGPGQPSQPSHGSANGSSYQPNQRPSNNNTGGPGQQTFQQRPSKGPASLPQHNPGAPNLPRPPVPAGPASLAPAFPHGIASLPPKPSAGLPSRPNFQSEASTSSSNSSGNVTPDSHQPTAPRSRMSTSEGLPKIPSAALPAKPVDAVAAAMASAAPKTGSAASPYRSQTVGSPPHPSRPAAVGRPAPGPYQGSPGGWYAGSGSAPSSTPASPAAPARGSAYSPGAGPQPAPGGGHYNPAYAGHRQQHAPAHSGWNPQQAHYPPPLHMAPGQQPYGGYGAPPHHGGYGAPPSGGWNNQIYPGSHYPGYAPDTSATASQHQYGSAANQGHYNPQAQVYNYGAYPGHAAAGTDAYNAYSHAAPPAHALTGATAPPAQDSYDPRSPSMGTGNQQQQQQQR